MSKKKDPAFLFYPEAFIMGTYTMTDEEVGQYIRLLCLQHQKGHLRSLGAVSEEVASKFIQDKTGLWYNRRLDEEKEKRQKFTESRRANGALGGRPRKPSENLEDNLADSNEKPSANQVPPKENLEETTSKPLAEPLGEPNENLPKNKNKNKDINTNTNNQERELTSMRERRDTVLARFGLGGAHE